MLSVKADKKLVHHIYTNFGEVVILKDLHNMAGDRASSILVDEMKKVNGKRLI